MSTRISKKIIKEVKKAQHIVLSPHQHPDGDALGSSSAFAQFLDTIDIPYSYFCSTDVPEHMHFLPQVQHITQDASIWKDVDMVIVFDSGDLRYNGIEQYIEKMQKKPTIINIDHHKTNEFYGNINLVRIDASSTCEVVYYLFKANDIHITPGMATSLLVGIVTDTDNFTNAATTPNSMQAASALVKLGGNFNHIKKQVYRRIPLTAFELWGIIFERLKKHPQLDLVYTYITQHDLHRYNVDENDIGGITNFLNAIEEGDAGMILKEREDGTIKGSFRTTRNDVDVSKISKHFGGGGHKKAAGFTVDGPMDHAIDRILKEIETMYPKKTMRE